MSEQHALSKIVEERCGAELAQAEKDCTKADTLLSVALADELSFANVEVGVSCPHCRQRVSEQHAAEVRKLLQNKLDLLRREKTDCEGKRVAAGVAHTAARNNAVTLKNRLAERSRIEIAFTTKKEHIDGEGASAEVAVLTSEIETLQEEAADKVTNAAELRRLAHEAETSATFSEDKAGVAAKAASAKEKKLNELDQRVAKLCGRRDEVLKRISPNWQLFAADLSIEKLQPLKTELAHLRRSNVAAKFEQLTKDSAQRSGWEDQAAIVRTDIAAIPEMNRVTEVIAEAARTQAEEKAQAADSTATNAAAVLRSLQAAAATYSTTAIALRAAEQKAGLLRHLDELLGEKGLQRELVRAAEHEVVALADDTLRQLSHQELSIEPDPEATGRADKAFALRVRKVGDPKPIGIDFMSGSQRFRVAVAIALALGRFAAGKHRPIEAVIIDEGFGSLDEDGLRAMAENLHELRRSQSLKRILLVSHQKNFTDQFDHGYSLTPGEGGTTAIRLA